jgi:hypothetical protein
MATMRTAGQDQATRRAVLATGAWGAGFILWLIGLLGARESLGVGWELAMLGGAGLLVSATLYRRWVDLGRKPLPSHIGATIVAYGAGGLTILTIVLSTAAMPLPLAVPLVFFGLVMVVYTFPPLAAILGR